MRTLPNGRIEIQGHAPQQIDRAARLLRTFKDRAIEENQLNNYFEHIEQGNDHSPQPFTFAPQTLFVNALVSEAPHNRSGRFTARIQAMDYTRRITASHYRFHAPTCRSTRANGEKITVFYFEESNFRKAMFYHTSKTLIMGDIFHDGMGLLYFKKVIDYLKENNLITPRQETLFAEPVPEPNTIKSIELHNGAQVMVSLKTPRKICTVGCDPEFEQIMDGAPIRPSMPNYGGEIGLDGAGFQIELRPKATETAEGTTENLRKLFEKTKQRHLSTIGNVYPLGGHVHIGVGHSYEPPSDLLFLLDYFLGLPTLPLSGTARAGYKNKGAYECKNWGFEYRTCPGAIFETPEFARISMKIAKTVTECYINEQKIIIKPQPDFEAYFNYCHLTPTEYDTFNKLVTDYRQVINTGYKGNTVGNWIDVQKIIEPANHTGAEDCPCRACTAERRAVADRAAEAAYEARQAARRAERLAAERSGLHMSDDWQPAAAEPFRRLLMPLATEAPIQIFGLASNRGDVTWNYEVPTMEQAEENTNALNAEGYGVPYCIRMGNATEEAEQHAEAIRQDILERLRGIANAELPIEPAPRDIPDSSIWCADGNCSICRNEAEEENEQWNRDHRGGIEECA